MPLEFAHQNRFWQSGNQVVQLQPQPDLGISYLLDDSLARIKSRPFVFNVMVAGASDLGKSTFLNTFFRTDIANVDEEEDKPMSTPHLFQTRVYPVQVEEEGVQFQLTAVDCSGLGEGLDRGDDVDMIIEYIDEQYRRYMIQEHAAHRPTVLPDTRIHLLFYLLPSTKGRLTEFDAHNLRKLAQKTNVIPLISKADVYTQDELARVKTKLTAEISHYELGLYTGPHNEDVPHTGSLITTPFAVIGSNQTHEVQGRQVRARQYPWGLIEVENPEHCDIPRLRCWLMKECLLDVIDKTHACFYADFRARLMRLNGRPESIMPFDDGFETKITSTQQKFARVMAERENDLRQTFMERIRVKEIELRDYEAKLRTVREALLRELELEQLELEREEANLPEEPVEKPKPAKSG
ncbi:Septin-domain-containing protein [Dimargaris cristalligena]|uniref:Septin-domain-containing protein n=1 Tax=Dimargaris cristalligena TaxID=215637 RepID=A0A4P9ZTV5_9FUNG|nr:Septin-domain-containing protein [Dimargaris cristalligena]|eukprot:RKP36963.1 Septin-domain-containing protein [Dimargaris cristalligena]